MRPSKKSRWDFSAEHPRRAHGLSALPTNRTLARIEVFFDPAKLGQKMDFKCPLRGQKTLFRQAVYPAPPDNFDPVCFHKRYATAYRS